jgi:hypothetical protein
VVSPESFRGYVLEEVLAFLIRNSGYRLLVNPSQGDQLERRANGLVVVGRGGLHQVDVLGQLAWIPAFTFPIRLFVEAKFRDRRVGIETVRNAIGVVSDLNQHYIRPSQSTGPALQLFSYRYALFSTSGFTDDASQLALAHQISLIDLAGRDFADIREMVQDLAEVLLDRGRDIPDFISLARMLIRQELETWPQGVPIDPRLEHFRSRRLIDHEARGVLRRLWQLREFFIGVVNGPFLLLIRPDNVEHFLRRMDERQADRVAIHWRYDEDDGRRWTITPLDVPHPYSLSFGLPETLAKWIFADQQAVIRRALDTKATLFSEITVYRYVHGRHQLYQLVYDAERTQTMIRHSL